MSLRKRFLLPALLGLPFMAGAIPAYPGLITVTDAEGTVHQVRAYGDEHFHYVTDAEGEYILNLDASGRWTKAERNGRLLRNEAGDVELLRFETLDKYTLSGEESNARARSQAPARMAQIDSEGRSNYPTIGEEVHGLVVLLEYADTPFSIADTQVAFDRMLNEVGYSDYNARGSARDYYLASSNGLFNVHFDVAEVVPLTHDHTYYSNGRDDSRFGYAIKEALEYLDAAGMDFSKYDYDNDGIIDNVFFFYAGYGQNETLDPDDIWPHQGNYTNYIYTLGLSELELDGKLMRTYACSNELTRTIPRGEEAPWMAGIGTFCHEYAHVLGLPDLYDVNYTNTPSPGRFSVMDQGPYNDGSRCPPLFSAYEQWCCRWLEFTEAEDGNEYLVHSLSDSETPEAVRIRLRRPTPTVQYFPEYYVLETRTKSGWDSSLPEEGMLVWRIDFLKSAWSGNSVNTNGRSRVNLISSGSRYAWPGSIDYMIPGDEHYFNQTHPTAINSIFLTDMWYDSEQGVSHFAYNVITEIPSDKTEMHYPVQDPDATRQIILSWDPVEGATDYQVTVSRETANGSVRYVDGYNERNVGNVTTVTVGNISASQWSQPFKVYVRVVRDIPSSEISNVIEFIPEEMSAVSEIEVDNVIIRGGVGCIYAPTGAEIYSVNGMRVGRENLSAGIYVVRYGSNVRKVVVR